MTARLGAHPDRAREGCEFRVWAPFRKRVDVKLVKSESRLVRLEPTANGYHEGFAEGVTPGAWYFYRLDGEIERPDPASRLQPAGVHGPSEVVAPFSGSRDESFLGRPLHEYIIYELHVGTFSAAGTFSAIVPHLSRLRDLGITAIELMPVAQFPGTRNWGYDGVLPFAVHEPYGGPRELRKLVEECHVRGLAVILDVVYNHLGPEGNYLADYGPYFTSVYQTPWGDALNFDGAGSDEVRRFFVENARMWIRDYHIDALRLDAVHAILDRSPIPFLEELSTQTSRWADRDGRWVYLIAESDANDPRLIRPREEGGYGLDAVWADDLHHACHVMLTGERHGYYSDYGSIDILERAYRDGFAFQGHYSEYRGRRHGAPTAGIPRERFVVCSQNHDQIGNRLKGDRLIEAGGSKAAKVAAALVLLSPHTPLLFMGEEYGETQPFLYFTSHGDPELGRLVREGRRREFAAFGWPEEPPDPQAEDTFRRCVIDPPRKRDERHTSFVAWYRELISLRREVLSLLRFDDLSVTPSPKNKTLTVLGCREDDAVLVFFNLSPESTEVKLSHLDGNWFVRLDSETFPASPGTLSMHSARAGHSVLVLRSEPA